LKTVEKPHGCETFKEDQHGRIYGFLGKNSPGWGVGVSAPSIQLVLGKAYSREVGSGGWLSICGPHGKTDFVASTKRYTR